MTDRLGPGRAHQLDTIRSEIPTRCGITERSVRIYLGCVFAKTDTRYQSQFVTRLYRKLQVLRYGYGFLDIEATVINPDSTDSGLRVIAVDSILKVQTSIAA